jgi:hypothetical protein
MTLASNSESDNLDEHVESLTRRMRRNNSSRCISRFLRQCLPKSKQHVEESLGESIAEASSADANLEQTPSTGYLNVLGRFHRDSVQLMRDYGMELLEIVARMLESSLSNKSVFVPVEGMAARRPYLLKFADFCSEFDPIKSTLCYERARIQFLVSHLPAEVDQLNDLNSRITQKLQALHAKLGDVKQALMDNDARKYQSSELDVTGPEFQSLLQDSNVLKAQTEQLWKDASCKLPGVTNRRHSEFQLFMQACNQLALDHKQQWQQVTQHLFQEWQSRYETLEFIPRCLVQWYEWQQHRQQKFNEYCQQQQEQQQHDRCLQQQQQQQHQQQYYPQQQEGGSSSKITSTSSTNSSTTSDTSICSTTSTRTSSIRINSTCIRLNC